MGGGEPEPGAPASPGGAGPPGPAHEAEGLGTPRDAPRTGRRPWRSDRRYAVPPCAGATGVTPRSRTRGTEVPEARQTHSRGPTTGVRRGRRRCVPTAGLGKQTATRRPSFSGPLGPQRRTLRAQGPAPVPRARRAGPHTGRPRSARRTRVHKASPGRAATSEAPAWRGLATNARHGVGGPRGAASRAQMRAGRKRRGGAIRRARSGSRPAGPRSRTSPPG